MGIAFPSPVGNLIKAASVEPLRASGGNSRSVEILQKN